MRAVLSEGLIDFKVANSENPAEGIKYTKMLLEKYKDDELVNIGVAAHAPYSCSAELMIEAKKLADECNTVFHIHVAETKGEFDSFV